MRSAPTDADRAARALADRLATAAGVLLEEGDDSRPGITGNPSHDAAALLACLVRHVAGRAQDPRSLWLLLTAVSASFPTQGEFHAMRYTIDGSDPVSAELAVLDWALDRLSRNGRAHTTMTIVGQPVMDVNLCATSNLHTGIQRVVRETAPRWVKQFDAIPVGWAPSRAGFRPLTHTETQRVLDWSGPITEAVDTDEGPLLVPWETMVAAMELQPSIEISDRLSCLARYSGNSLGVIGYDCIPVTSFETITPGDHGFFAAYLNMVKYAESIVTISRSALQEFAGFVDMLGASHHRVPRVLECQLPTEQPLAEAPRVEGPGGSEALPLVLSVGSHEPRKNHLAVLFAAESLWREGLPFSLEFVGGSGWMSEDFYREVALLQKKGRSVTVRKGVSDRELNETYRRAAITLFPSLHEGFGLPVAESLAFGTPVITSNFGSMSEIAGAGGAILVDPRDDTALIDALRQSLTVPSLLARLTAEAKASRKRTWDEYAQELMGAMAGDRNE